MRALGLVMGLVVVACSGTTTDSESPSGSGGASAGTGGGGGIDSDASVWPDGGGAVGGGGAGGSSGSGGSGGGGASGGAGGASGGAGGSSATGGGGAGGSCGPETCNNKDDDCDGTVDDGLSQSCTTTCGTGTQACAAGVWGACSAAQPQSCMNYATCKTEPQCTCAKAPPETCNLKDDNCDNNCDDFANCRVGVHRSYKSGEHFYTTNLTEAGCCGFTLEFQNFYYLYSASTPGLVPFHRCVLSNGKHFYTQSATCEGSPGSKLEGVMGYVATSAVCGAVPLYRMSHPSSSHFFTPSLAEKNQAVTTLGYKDEGVAGYVWTAP